MRPARKRVGRRRGSMLVVVMLVIVAVLLFSAAAVVLAGVIFKQETGDAERAQLEGLAQAIEAFGRDTTVLPKSNATWTTDLTGPRPAWLAGVLTTNGTPVPWNGPYVLDRLASANSRVTAKAFVDAWGNQIQWNPSTRQLTSYGPDGLPGTADDLVWTILPSQLPAPPGPLPPGVVGY